MRSFGPADSLVFGLCIPNLKTNLPPALQQPVGLQLLIFQHVACAISLLLLPFNSCKVSQSSRVVRRKRYATDACRYSRCSKDCGVCTCEGTVFWCEGRWSLAGTYMHSCLDKLSLTVGHVCVYRVQQAQPVWALAEKHVFAVQRQPFIADGGIIIDLSMLKCITVDQQQRLVTVQGMSPLRSSTHVYIGLLKSGSALVCLQLIASIACMWSLQCL